MLSSSRLLLSVAVFLFSSCLWAGEIILNVVNVRNDNGFLMAALHDSEASFPDEEGVLIYFMTKAHAGQTIVRFSVDEPGQYAVSMFHDEDNDGELKYSSYGSPLDGFAFSNNAIGVRGAPDFIDAALDFYGGVVEQTIYLHY